MKTKLKKDFTEGPLFFRITLFALPIMLTGMLQILYNMADNIVVGKFSGDPNALAAVGCTGSLTTLIINLLLGIASGAGVVVAQLYGAKDNEKLSRTVHTSMLFSLFGGIFTALVGLIVARPALVLMGTKLEILDSAVLYLSIICIGIPANSVYNFGASILRSTGDSKTPLIILSIAGIINVVLNLVFVIGFRMTVDGVAIATITSQYISAIAVVLCLANKKGEAYRFSFSKLCLDKRLLSRILRYGLPTGLQSAMFSIANVLMTSAVNTFPTSTVTANTIAGNVDAFTYTAMNSFSQASMTFVGQNYGAMKPERIKKSIIYSVIQVLIFGSFVSGTELIFKHQLISLFVDKSSPDALVVTETASSLITMLLVAYLICGVMDIVGGALKGLGFVFNSMLINMFCICGVRVFWIYVIFPMKSMNTLTGLYTVYPVSWTLALIGMTVLFLVKYNKLKNGIFKIALEKEASKKDETSVAV
ncbi:MAG: MATE family efflux transporter [Clostridia bacterium]|nr:MATE family efflux transporter [Clostridia bacterium]